VRPLHHPSRNATKLIQMEDMEGDLMVDPGFQVVNMAMLSRGGTEAVAVERIQKECHLMGGRMRHRLIRWRDIASIQCFPTQKTSEDLSAWREMTPTSYPYVASFSGSEALGIPNVLSCS
jgi:hypothetical protein